MSVTAFVWTYVEIRECLPAIHVLQTHYDITSFIEKSAVKGNNVGRVALVHDLQLPHYALPNFLLGFDVYDLKAR